MPTVIPFATYGGSSIKNGRSSESRQARLDGRVASELDEVKWDSYPDVKYGIKLGYKNIGWNGQFYTFPYFLTFLLKRFLKER